MLKYTLSVFFALLCFWGKAEDGYRLWLRYDKVQDAALLQRYQSALTALSFYTSSATLDIAKKELIKGISGLTGNRLRPREGVTNNCIIAGTPASSVFVKKFFQKNKLNTGNEGYVISTGNVGGKKVLFIAATKDIGVLYGVFAFLRLLQTNQPLENLFMVSAPKIQNRILDHWDNLNRTVERGYAGASIWNWHTLPDYIDQRYIDYARANASVGINGTVLTNVNANARVLTKTYLIKVKALADVFRPYGLKVYLTAKFSAPVEIGGLKTADPLDPGVRNWWKEKCDEIYSMIPDFGGFLVKANSEGQPGPQSYGRTHADGANMFADALAPHGGIVMWRAFVYDLRVQKEQERFEEGNKGGHGNPIAAEDRFKQAYNEFAPLDGKFKKNVLLQVKNGPIDFQPREPFSPLFGAMPETQLMMEFQLTQEYLGQGTHLVFEAPLFKEVLDADTYARGMGSVVAKVIDGSLYHHPLTAIAGVANIGNDINWTGHPFGQANWYAFGRLAWDHELSSARIANEWVRQTFSNNRDFVTTTTSMMLASREILVDYMTPLGLNHIMGTGHHYGPAPWVDNAGRADWNPVYYHRADSEGLGFNRTANGSNALAQYRPEVQKQWDNSRTCDEKYLLWFHHVPWNFKMHSGRSLWEALCYKYNIGCDSVKWMQREWNAVKPFIDEERFKQVQQLLVIQEKEAVWWRDACLLYFQTFSKMPVPAQYEKPQHTLEYYKSLKFSYAPGIGGNL
ncbi:alpha-glucuronidase [Niabella soli DSM 19437]|uniref:Xylan alpha-1,2-glucuronidase n=1 Tax=Niabella soli DSM 19437 TaxID=929713 RepID=W0EYK1_9BACT|nr:alpha-glucuronidase [Niabella soli DSM 19437]